MGKIKPICILFLLGLFISCACSSSARSTPDPDAIAAGEAALQTLSAEDSAALATRLAIPTRMTTPRPTPTPSTRPISAGLDELNSYRARMELRLSGKDGTQVLIMEQQRLWYPAQISTHVEVQTDGSVTEAYTIYQLGEETWLYTETANGQKECFGMERASLNLPREELSPADFLGTVKVIEPPLETAELEGFTACRYSVLGSNLGMGGAEFTNGDVWIAENDGIILRYSGTAHGKVFGILSARSMEGDASWNYSVTDTNTLTEIIIPENCLEQQQLKDIMPMPASAIGAYSSAGVMIFNSTEAPTSLADFYRKSLTELGWVVEDTMTTEDLIRMEAANGLETIEIIITVTQTGSSVILQKIESAS